MPINDPGLATEAAAAPRLSHSLRARHLAMISIGGIIGAGLFVGSGTVIRAAGPASFISYAATGLLILAVMRMLAEMASALPGVRSFTDFARVGLGNGAGFVTGWLYWYFWVLVVPVEAIAGAKILQAWIPLSRLQLGAGLMVLMTAVNLMSVRSYAEFEFGFATIKVAAILAFVTIAAAFACGLISAEGATFANLVQYGGFTPHGWVAVLAAVPAIFFAMTGAESVTIAAAESAHPTRAVAQMSGAIVWRILIGYVLSVFLIVCVTPWTAIRSGESPFTAALESMRVPWAGTIMSVVILTAVLSCLNSAFYLSSRVLFALASHADAPPALVRLNARKVPVMSVMIGSTAGFLGVLAATQAPGVVFDLLVSSSGAVILFVYAMTAVAQIKLRYARERARVPDPPIRMWLFPYCSIAVVVAMSAVLTAMAWSAALRVDLVMSCLALLIAVGAYLGLRRARERAAGAADVSAVRSAPLRSGP
jgi:GABA permease